MMIWTILLFSLCGLALTRNVENIEFEPVHKPEIEFAPVPMPPMERNMSIVRDPSERLDMHSALLMTRVSHLGDIALTEEEKERSQMRCANFPDRCRWPNGNVGICIKYDDYPNDIQWDIYNCVMDLNERLKNCGAQARMTGGSNCLKIHSGSGCWSQMGYNGGEQPLSIQYPGCTGCATIQHEILHAMGFGHEQGRHDRDKYVDILWNNIPDNWKGSYNEDGNDMVDIGKYDYYSVMHYPWWAPDSDWKDAFNYKRIGEFESDNGVKFDKNKVGGGKDDGLTPQDCQKVKWRYDNWDKK